MACFLLSDLMALRGTSLSSAMEDNCLNTVPLLSQTASAFGGNLSFPDDAVV